MKISNIFIIIISIFTFKSVFADGDFSKEVMKATPLTSSLYMLEGAGGNITALIGAEGVLLVDDDFAPMAKKLEAKLKELGGNSPRFIVNTHFHYDHTGGNEVFGKTATIISSIAVRNRLLTKQILWKKEHLPFPSFALPTITFDDSLTLHINGEEVKLVHLNHGHTDGDTIVFFQKGKVVSMGDLYFSGMYPIFHPEHDGSLVGYAQNIAKVLRLIPDDFKIVSGHGPLSNKTELEKYYKMILASMESVKKGIKEGQTLEQIQKNGLAPEWESFSHGYLTTDRWIALIYQELNK